jgi:3-oxoacyl-[acyl-carrier protein] reductase
MNLQNKIAIVTGGSRGIGAATARRLGACGATVLVVYSGHKDAADSVVADIVQASGVAHAYQCDVSDYAATKQLVETILASHIKVDILVNNAGITRDKLVLQMTESDWDSVLDTNLKGAFNMIKHLYPTFVRQRCGRIINISSVSGLDGNVGQANYSSSKAGVVGLTKSIARELGGRGITCNAVAPGFVDTAMTADLSLAIKEKLLERIPMRRMGTPDEIAHAVAFLASEHAAYITGQVLRVDGGLG